MVDLQHTVLLAARVAANVNADLVHGMQVCAAARHAARRSQASI